MPVSHTHKCIFVHIPRTGGTSIESALAVSNENHREDLSKLTGWIQSNEIKQHGFTSPVLQHLTLRDMSRILPADVLAGYFKFAIVRNPWERILSIYTFARREQQSRVPRRSESFPELEEYLQQLNPFHRLEQWDFIRDAGVEIDYVGRFESLASDFAAIAGKIGLEDTHLPHLNRTRHQHYSSYYSRQAREMVAELYSNDIAKFGYSFD